MHHQRKAGAGREGHRQQGGQETQQIDIHRATIAVSALNYLFRPAVQGLNAGSALASAAGSFSESR